MSEFDCFGSDSDDEETYGLEITTNNEASGEISHVKQENTTSREKSCGVLAFHPNTEQSLLMHVSNAMDNGGHNEGKLPCERVLEEIDWFCSQRHWMMCVGPEKGAIIQKTLSDAIGKFENEQAINQSRSEFLAVELGTYCGYGAIFLASLLKRRSLDRQASDNEYTCNFHLFTVEINPEFAAVAKKMIALAEVDDIVTVVNNELLLNGNTADVGDLVKSSFHVKYGRETNLDIDRIDFLMIDHDKDSYLSDLKILESSGLISVGTIVAADNVIFASITNYLEYMKDMQGKGIVRTSTVEASVEYCLPDVDESHSESFFKDGVEISEYLQNP